MPAQEIKAIYTALKESGDLATLFPGMTGNWEKDERSFTSQYNSNEQILSEDFDLDEDLELY